jgi:glycosyltransferase involved in cell wall biosynthesis
MRSSTRRQPQLGEALPGGMVSSRASRSVAFLINGEHQSPVAIRARGLGTHLRYQYDIGMAHRTASKNVSILRFLRFLGSRKPAITYVFDMAYSGVIAALLYKLFFRNRVIIDTGDSVYALAHSMGTRSQLGMWLTWLLEFCSFRYADQIIVRGTVHKQLLSSKGIRVEVVQDGVESELFRPMDVNDLRSQHGLDGVTTIGFVGSIAWSSRFQMCYGSELVEALSLLQDLPVKGVVIGDGSGLNELKRRARELGIEDRILFLGRLSYHELPQYLNLIDICLSTQTNDAPGQVRTTGKLPLYLASGRFVLASRVGEAAILLPESMLVDYESTQDQRYPTRLAEKVRAACENPRLLDARKASRPLAVENFDYALLARRLSMVLAHQFGDGSVRSSG